MSIEMSSQGGDVHAFDLLDRLVIGYIVIPLVIFLAGWFWGWVAVPLVGCVAYASKMLMTTPLPRVNRHPVTRLQLIVAIAVGSSWALLGGGDHLLFANADWHVRDAVLHDLVVSPWPVGYGALDGQESLLRAPLAFYLPAALIGKWTGLSSAHLVMSIWTALGATLFLLQVLSLLPSRLYVVLGVACIVVMFSGLDIVGSLLNDGPRFRSDWNITTHLEWWAGKYQYSSMTTQLFWVPNHALAGWLMIGLLLRNQSGPMLFSLLPMAFVALALWSPLTAIGFIPFACWKFASGFDSTRLRAMLDVRVLAPALAVALVVAGYLLLDSARVDKGISVGGDSSAAAMDLLQQAQFFLLEAGFIGAAILAIRPSVPVIIALVVLALLPLVYLGPGNDLVMRASIPSLAMLAVCACLALFDERDIANRFRKRATLATLLAVGAMTPFAEIARAVVLPTWPINLEATLIGANCGGFPAHYVARLGGHMIARLLRAPHRSAIGPLGAASCDNPALDLMWGGEVR